MLETTIGRAAGGNAWRRLGKIKLGIKVQKGEKEYPQDVDYFVIPDAPGANPNFYREALGEKPQELEIVLANPELQQNFDTRRALYRGNNSRVCHSSDGVKAMRYMRQPNENAHRWTEIACPNLACEFSLNKQCKPRGYFSFMLPKVGEIGIFLLVMGSQVGAVQIYTALKMVETMCKGRPQGMFGIRLKLRRERKEFFQDVKNDGNLAKIVKWIPMVEIDFKQLLHDDQIRLGPVLGMQVLPPPAETAPDILDHDDEEPDEGGAA